jgi:hypothetical protein
MVHVHDAWSQSSEDFRSPVLHASVLGQHDVAKFKITVIANDSRGAEANIDVSLRAWRIIVLFESIEFSLTETPRFTYKSLLSSGCVEF